MNNMDMKKMLRCGLALAVMLFALASCMNDDPIATSPECAIIDFSVNDIKCDVTTQKYDQQGNAYDTIVSRTLDGSNVHFNIDQVEGRIYVVDSLPKWVDLTKLVPNILSQGSVRYRIQGGDGIFYPIISGTTEIDFSNPVEFQCVSTDELTRRTYLVNIFKHRYDTDTLVWNTVDTNLSVEGRAKMFHADGRVFLFAKNVSGQSFVTIADERDAARWSTPVAVPVDASSVVQAQGKFYALASDGRVYVATFAEVETTEWTQASTLSVERLLAADAYGVYVYDGTAVRDLYSHAVVGMDDLDKLPQTSLNSVSYASKVNPALQTTLVTGLTPSDDKHSVVWYRCSGADEAVSQPWTQIQVTNDNPWGMPHFDHFSMALFDGALYAVGAEEGRYKYLYRSDDSGITWHPLTAKYLLPKDLKDEDGTVALTAVNGMLWMVQENGKVWQGFMR